MCPRAVAVGQADESALPGDQGAAFAPRKGRARRAALRPGGNPLAPSVVEAYPRGKRITVPLQAARRGKHHAHEMPHARYGMAECMQPSFRFHQRRRVGQTPPRCAHGEPTTPGSPPPPPPPGQTGRPRRLATGVPAFSPVRPRAGYHRPVNCGPSKVGGIQAGGILSAASTSRPVARLQVE